MVSTPTEPEFVFGIPEHASTARPEGVLSLAASEFALDIPQGFAAKCRPEDKTPILATQRKTGIYNMLSKQGQTYLPSADGCLIENRFYKALEQS